MSTSQLAAMSAPQQKRRNVSGEFWIKPGIFVHQRHGQGPIMTVLRIKREARKVKGETLLMVKGVECRWIDAYGQPQRDTFHTKELIPWPNG